jgi:ABC-2 type transport system permease protein
MEFSPRVKALSSLRPLANLTIFQLSNFAFMRANGSLDYFASLSIHKHNLILATLFAFFLLSLPAVLITIFVGAWILGAPLTPNPLFLPILPLTAIPLAAVGAYIGIRTRTLEDATSIATMLTLVMLGLGPVLIPPARLPDLLLTLGYLSPATYAASALRQTLLGPITPRLLLDVAVLLLLAIPLLWVVARKMQWREQA